MKSKYLYATLGILALTTPAMGKLVVTVLPGKPYIDAAYEQKAECGVKISWSEPKHITDGTKAESVFIVKKNGKANKVLIKK